MVISPYAFAVCLTGSLLVDLDIVRKLFDNKDDIADAVIWMFDRLLLSKTETFHSITQSIRLWISNSTASEALSPIPAAALLISCLLSIVTNLFGFMLIHKTSAITYQVVGHLKTVLTIIIGAILFPSSSHRIQSIKIEFVKPYTSTDNFWQLLKTLSSSHEVLKWVGIFVTLVGMVLYSRSRG
ncbi:hypothetical protein HDV05_006793 [Chytridiales sp. JEL 0842]|nr:hypothetical protein HDV05_006793 [Chytridiales sp. JEL 0842]